MTSLKIAGAGICCLDYIVVAPTVPPGNTGRVKDFHKQGGGLVATALVACARLGAHCELWSLLGDDETGNDILTELNEERVSTAGVWRIEDGHSPFSFIHVDAHSGERTIYHRSAQTMHWKRPDEALSEIKGCGALLIDDYFIDLATSAAKTARKAGVPVIADMIPDSRNKELLESVDILIAPRHFAENLGCQDNPREALDAIHELGPETAVLTLGADGYVYSDKNGTGGDSAFRVDVVDTTGAGDTFHGAFAYGTARGWDTPRCCEFAAAVAAIKCTAPGGRTGLPTLHQTLEFLQQRGALGWGSTTNPEKSL
ncbi:MAG: PfkB family carbohydrate kinase [Armatimonadota bacterium]